MKHCISILLSAVLLTGCAQDLATETAEAPETVPIEPQTEPVPADAGSDDPDAYDTEVHESWVLDLLEGVFGYDELDTSEAPQQQWQTPPAETKPPLTEQELQSAYTLTADTTGLVTRTDGIYDDNLTWVIEYNGSIVLERNAEHEMTYRPMEYGYGTYRVWLKAWVDGYSQVSNIVEFSRPTENPAQQDDIVDEWTRSLITEKKGHMKHLVHRIIAYGMPEYKIGFVIDPDHDGYYNGVVFCAGRGDDGELVQYVYDNQSSSIHFGTAQYAEESSDCTLGIWCDAVNGKDYIVRIESDGTVYDCCTEEVIPEFAEDDKFFTFTDADPSDRDHFYVSYDGTTVLEGA